ncbi:putative aldose 1-epimerase [Escherichia coli]|uniref:Putative aldose 1-epimerase n=1 Tax=Escherichia coli TaxID=562 RepID=A0A376VFZ3_ECOLX|nr:putative aldose 1-epimerase [Escherichia coli]
MSGRGVSINCNRMLKWDAHYLHGDGWLGQWQCVSRSEDSLCLVYETSQRCLSLSGKSGVSFNGRYADGDALCHQSRGRDAAIWYRLASLFSVVTTNADSGAGERLLAGAGSSGWRGEFCEQLPQELDFKPARAVAAPVGKQWLCRMEWVSPASSSRRRGTPSSWKRRHLHHVISSLFPTRRLIKDMPFDFFCLEPMSHAPDDHHRPEGGDSHCACTRGINTSEMSLRVALL